MNGVKPERANGPAVFLTLLVTGLEMNTHDNLAGFFNWRCAQQPDALAYAFVRDTLETADSLTFTALHRQVHGLAAELVRHSEPGDRVLLVYPPGVEFVRAFWACMVTGRIAVPVPAPDPVRFKNNAPRLRAIILDAQAEPGADAPRTARAGKEFSRC